MAWRLLFAFSVLLACLGGLSMAKGWLAVGALCFTAAGGVGVRSGELHRFSA